MRRASFDAHSGVVRIEDEITAPAGPVVWRAFTAAEAEVCGERVILRHPSAGEITLRRVGAAGTWSITGAQTPTPAENPNKGFHAVVLTAPQAATVSLVVEIRPGPTR